MEPRIERRALTALAGASPAASVDGRRARGYVARWGDETPMRGHLERIELGAFTESIKTRDVLALWSHDQSAVLGRTSSGTLALTEDRTGLEYLLDLPDTTHGRDAAELLRRGDIGGASVGMIVDEDTWTMDRFGYPIRSIQQATLVEISLVGLPAYPTTSATLT